MKYDFTVPREPDGTVVTTQGSIEILWRAISQEQYNISGKCTADVVILTEQYHNSSTNIAISVLQYRHCILDINRMKLCYCTKKMKKIKHGIILAQ